MPVTAALLCGRSLLLLLLLLLLPPPPLVRPSVAQAQKLSTDDLPGLLYPRESPFRERRDLGGVWNFRACPLEDQHVGFVEKWYNQPLDQTGPTIPMPVPSSYNDITQEAYIRDYVGWVWYDYEFFVPGRYRNDSQRHVLYFGSAHYEAVVWLNGAHVVNHSIGHLPFEAEVSAELKYGLLNRITVALSSMLTQDTVPQGFVTYFNDTTRYPKGFFEVYYNFDFMNYAGLHRPVVLCTTPATYIDDITVTTGIEGSTGVILYKVEYVSDGTDETPVCHVDIYDQNRTLVAQQKGFEGRIEVPKAKLWWPYLMDANPGYLYTAHVRIVSSAGNDIDIYYQTIGIRTVSWTNTSFMINGKPFYFRGFGKHEDYDIRGKGMDYPSILKDFNLLKWIGANSFRTSHYPYADEILDRADAEGIAIVSESPACTLDFFGNALLQNHKQAMAELVRRDKNRPSVVMWSLGNEPRSAKKEANAYFGAIRNYTKEIDPTGRPVTVALAASVDQDQVAQHLDVVSVNRYFAWYQDTGHLELIQLQMEAEYSRWHDKFNKPIMNTEYGADSVAGLHMSPPYVFTEDYQAALLNENFKAFDTLRSKGFFVGEMVWNFADFLTPQGTTRVVGNKKGVFTRQRQPKMAAYVLRNRYWSLARKLDNVTSFPRDTHLVCS